MLNRARQLLRVVRAYALPQPSSHKTVAWRFEQHARGAAAERPFLLYADQRFSYRAANAEVNRHAHAYRALGVGKGDVVALLLENRPAFLFHYLALGKLGAVASLINTHNTGAPLLHSLCVCAPKLVVVGSEHLAAFEAVRHDLGAAVRVCVDVDPERPLRPALELWSDVLAGAGTHDPPETAQHRLEDLAAYVYTSGTTGLPKAARVRQQRLFWLGEIVGGMGWGVRPDDVIYNCLPLYHTNAIGVATGSVICYGATLALARKFSTRRFWDDVRQHGATGFIYIGELCRYLINQPVRADDRQHQVRAMVGNGLRADIWVKFQQRFGIARVGEFYGSTEGNIGTLNLGNSVGSVGRLWFGGVLARWDENEDDFVRGADGFLVKCKPGEPGLLLGKITRRAGFDGYEDAGATDKKVVRDAFARGDAWFNTGDLLRMDRTRRLFFVDRIGDTFRWKGENVSTFEVQEQLSSWPPAAEVNAYGVPIPGTEGKAGMIALVLKDAGFDCESFRAHVDSNLPAYARPLFVRVREKLETTPTFKLKKGELISEGFEPCRVRDPIYFRHPARNAYVRLTAELFEQLKQGKLKL